MLIGHFTFVFPVHLCHRFLVELLIFFLIDLYERKFILSLVKMARKTLFKIIEIGVNSITVE